jgi:hypothetical protein
MNKIETLPKYVQYMGDTCFLKMHITAWGKYCLCYEGLEKDETGNRVTILSVVVEGEHENPDAVNSRGFVPDSIFDIADAVDIDGAVDITLERIKKHFELVWTYIE